MVRAVRRDSSGTLWVGTGSGGLNRLAPASAGFTVFRHVPEDPSSLSHDYVRCIHEDARGTLWIGTDGGLNRFDPETGGFERYTTKEGLPNNVVYGVLEDEDGNLWMGTNNGLARFDPQARSFRNFDSDDGLQGSEFNTGAYLRARNGEMFFGGINGLNSFLPGDIKENPHLPPVAITDLRLFNQSVQIGEASNGRSYLSSSITETDAIELSYKDSVISFDFAVLDFTSPEKNELAYKMEGLEEEWNYVGGRRFATYTTLPAGDYTLRVKGSNNDGVWNEAGASLRITVTPPFWETVWFMASVVGSACLLVAGVYSIRVRNIEARRIHLERVVDSRTFELRKKKEEIERQKGQLEDALEELEEAKDKLVAQAHKAGMADVAADVLHNVGNILNSAQTSAGVVREVARNLRVDGLTRANQLLFRADRANLSDSGGGVVVGDQLAQYYAKLEEAFRSDRECLEDNARRVVERMDAINQVLHAQRQLAAESFSERLLLANVVETAIGLGADALDTEGVTVETSCDAAPVVSAQKPKLIQVLLRLFENAIEAMREVPAGRRTLTLRTSVDAGTATVRITDNGRGIEKSRLDAIFSPEPTNARQRQGTNLHRCANQMTEMGGRISAESEGRGCGATFVLSFPCET